jgi:N6-L-threonylcarbamoyladenine synthase
LTLAIETSCDDTSVAILEKTTCRTTSRTAAKLHFHKKVTANNAAYNGVHPLVALESHQENLAKLVAEAIDHLPPSKLGKAIEHGDIDEDELGQDILSEVQSSQSIASKRLPDFISVTRGPGMRSNLFTGLDTAKGLAVAWGKPFIGVHHMQAHALTPRLVAALQNYGALGKKDKKPEESVGRISVEPEFPFLSVLASGGHTLLIHSASLTDHEIMGSTSDVAIGECLDKVARIVLPTDVRQKAGNIMYGALLERFAFPQPDVGEENPETTNTDTSQDEPSLLERWIPSLASAKPTAKKMPTYILENSTAAEYQAKYASRYSYEVPRNQEEALKRNVSKWGWGFNQPLNRASGGLKNGSLEMSFSGLMTAVERVVKFQLDPQTHKLTKTERASEDISLDERRDLAHQAMRAAFEHLAGRVVLGLRQSRVETVVMAGGVAANAYLRYILACTLCAKGFGHVNIVIPPASLCCDNAAMIAWAGMEMFQNGMRDPLSIRAVRKWPLDQLLSPPIEKTSRFTNTKDPAS